jgi:ribonuclease E
MGNKMLIDSSHGEETRVVVARGSRIEEFDFESASRKPLKGNIYLAKVTRVEPSLQAAFVEYGGNRHGFLAFTEIHPDYYQIPIADRIALIKEQEEEAAAEAADEEAEGDAGATGSDDGDHDHHSEQHADADGDDSESEDSDDDSDDEHDSEPETRALSVEPEPFVSATAPDDSHEDSGDEAEDAAPSENGETPPSAEEGEIVTVEEDAESRSVDSVGAEDALEEVPQRKPRQHRRRYKIQEVIKRRQILLVQVVKEERGNKGAALTTFLSLAGRYCVLMPNTARGGGISRKITDTGDRRRLKEVARDIEIPQGMGLIVRTAGAQRTRPEIKRDFDYLMRLWESVRDLTLQSQAPSLVYEEGSLIKRSIRDLYTKDVDEVIVEGEAAYKEAKDFMRMLMPSHAKNVKLYKEPRPLFARYQVESHLDALFSPTVNLPSGGYLVINQAEALVAIDINSGRATREHSIEDTAAKTNLEACDEIARQLRLRDLAGLVVIDFIDMEENRNNRAVERRMKDALKNDRARIQVGRISHFGLLEMSRQRLRPGLTEGTFRTCPHCEGRGIVRSVGSCGLGVLRQIEDYLQNKRAENLTVKCARDVVYYLLNEKRDNLLSIEQTYGITIFVIPGANEMQGTQAIIERAPERETAPRRLIASTPVQMDSALDGSDDEIAETDVPVEEETEEAEADSESSSSREPQGSDEAQRDGRKRRRRGRRGGRNGSGGRHGQREEGSESSEASQNANEADDQDGSEPDNRPEPELHEHVDEVAAEGSEGPAESEGEGRSDDGRKRRRFGRNRGRKERTGDGAARGGGERNRERGDRDSRPPRGERTPSESIAEPASETPRAAPVIVIPDTIAEPEPRKWQPPAPTIAAEPAQRRAGWWSKRKPE